VCLPLLDWVEMAAVELKDKELKELSDAIQNSALHRVEAARIAYASMQDFVKELKAAQKLWRTGNNSTLVKLGLLLIAFPDPTVSDILGSALVAAGLIQMKMRNSALHVEDVYKTYPMVLRKLGTLKEIL